MKNIKNDFKIVLKNDRNLYEDIINPDDNNIYALINYSITNDTKFNTINTLYLIDLKKFQFKTIFASNQNIKANDVKELLAHTSIPKNSIILTLNTSPFSTYVVLDCFKNKNLQHVYFNKKHYTPVIDHSKNYLHNIISITLFNKKHITFVDIENITKIWNTELSPILSKIAKQCNLSSDKLYFK